MGADKIMYAEVNFLCIVILLLLASKLRRTDKSYEQAYLISLLIGQSCLFLPDALWIMIDGIASYPRWMNYAVNTMYYTASSLCPYLCLRYIRLTLTGKRFALLTRLLLLLPAAVILVLSLTCPITGWVFSISADNVYSRGPLYLFQFAIPLLYMLFNACTALYYGMQSHSRHLRKRAYQLCFIMIMPVCGAILEVIFPKLSVVCSFITISMVSIIYDFQQQQITRDPLTQLGNRYELQLRLEERLSEHLQNGKQIYVMYADIDYFKSINDTYGHLEGDHALCLTADALRSLCRNRDAFPARIGGDEFVVVFSARNDISAEIFRHEMKETVLEAGKDKPYRLSMSAGFACSSGPDETVSELIERADAKLYEEKKNRPPRA